MNLPVTSRGDRICRSTDRQWCDLSYGGLVVIASTERARHLLTRIQPRKKRVSDQDPELP
jgi:hypothetical protein